MTKLRWFFFYYWKIQFFFLLFCLFIRFYVMDILVSDIYLIIWALTLVWEKNVINTSIIIKSWFKTYKEKYFIKKCVILKFKENVFSFKAFEFTEIHIDENPVELNHHIARILPVILPAQNYARLCKLWCLVGLCTSCWSIMWLQLQIVSISDTDRQPSSWEKQILYHDNGAFSFYKYF